MEIKATGTKNGERLTVTITKQESGFDFLFNGAHDLNLQQEIESRVQDGVTIGGTYYPKTEEFKLYAAVSGFFFDRVPDYLDAHGIKEKIPQPCGKNGVY